MHLPWQWVADKASVRRDPSSGYDSSMAAFRPYSDSSRTYTHREKIANRKVKNVPPNRLTSIGYVSPVLGPLGQGLYHRIWQVFLLSRLLPSPVARWVLLLAQPPQFGLLNRDFSFSSYAVTIFHLLGLANAVSYFSPRFASVESSCPPAGVYFSGQHSVLADCAWKVASVYHL